jgi:hypothetical protein
MGRNVNVGISGWNKTGDRVRVDVWEVDIALDWTGNDGQKRTHAGTYKFPHILADVPLRRLRGYMEDIILREARLAVGVDEEDEG